MYKPNKKYQTILRFIKSITHWLKRKIILIIVALMVGLSNGIYEEDINIFDNQFNIEQEEKDKNDDNNK